LLPDPLAFGARSGHSVEEALDLGGEVRLALGDEDVAGGTPSTFDFLSGRYKG
jgi:hypothetical protein